MLEYTVKTDICKKCNEQWITYPTIALLGGGTTKKRDKKCKCERDIEREALNKKREEFNKDLIEIEFRLNPE